MANAGGLLAPVPRWLLIVAVPVWLGSLTFAAWLDQHDSLAANVASDAVGSAASLAFAATGATAVLGHWQRRRNLAETAVSTGNALVAAGDTLHELLRTILRLLADILPVVRAADPDILADLLQPPTDWHAARCAVAFTGGGGGGLHSYSDVGFGPRLSLAEVHGCITKTEDLATLTSVSPADVKRDTQRGARDSRRAVKWKKVHGASEWKKFDFGRWGYVDRWYRKDRSERQREYRTGFHLNAEQRLIWRRAYAIAWAFAWVDDSSGAVDAFARNRRDHWSRVVELVHEVQLRCHQVRDTPLPAVRGMLLEADKLALLMKPLLRHGPTDVTDHRSLIAAAEQLCSVLRVTINVSRELSLVRDEFDSRVGTMLGVRIDDEGLLWQVGQLDEAAVFDSDDASVDCASRILDSWQTHLRVLADKMSDPLFRRLMMENVDRNSLEELEQEWEHLAAELQALSNPASPDFEDQR